MADEVVTSGTAAPADTGAPASSPATVAAPAAATATPSAPAAAAAPAAPAVEPSWLRGRLDETRAAATRAAQAEFARKEAEYQTQLQAVQRQLQALVGVTPPQNPEVENIRNQFSQLYPGLAKVESYADKLEALLEKAGDFDTQQNHYWQSYGRQTMDSLFKLAEGSLGGNLSDEGKATLHSAFVGYISATPERQARYAQDPTIVEDFWRGFSSSLIDPARRGATATVATRAAAVTNLPQDTPGGVPRAAGAPAPQNLDDRAALAWAQYQQNAKK